MYFIIFELCVPVIRPKHESVPVGFRYLPYAKAFLEHDSDSNFVAKSYGMGGIDRSLTIMIMLSFVKLESE